MGLVILLIIGIILIIAIISAVIVVLRISTYNNLIKLRNKVKNSWAQIDTQLQRRFDLIPNLLETVKGFTEHEEKILNTVYATKNNFTKAQSDIEKMVVNKQLSSQLQALYNVANHYPQLKSNEHFLKLQVELTEIEEDITYARQFYNDAVTIYNNALMSFPANIIASKYGFKEEQLFDAVKEAEFAPQINFFKKPPYVQFVVLLQLVMTIIVNIAVAVYFKKGDFYVQQ